MIYLWGVPDGYPQGWVGEYDTADTRDRMQWIAGKPLDDATGIGPFRFDQSAEQLRHWDQLDTNTGVPLVSRRLADLLTHLCPEEVQFFDSPILAAGTHLAGYRMLNATRIVRAIDHAASRYSRFPQTDAIIHFQKLRLHPNSMGSCNLARDAEYLPHLLTSDRVRSACRDAGIRGVSFLRPEQLTF